MVRIVCRFESYTFSSHCFWVLTVSEFLGYTGGSSCCICNHVIVIMIMFMYSCSCTHLNHDLLFLLFGALTLSPYEY
jgi:hypothetical protein